MELARSIFLGLHLVGMAGLIVSLLASRKRLSLGILHSALLAFVTGIALVVIRHDLNDQNPAKWANVDNVEISFKTLFLTTILIIGFRHRKSKTLSLSIWWIILILSLGNISIAIL